VGNYMKKRKLILHIGTEKTGTSSIQSFLYENKKLLAKKGYHFIQSLGIRNNRDLPSMFMNDEHFDDYYIERGISSIEGKQKLFEQKSQSLKLELAGLSDSIHTVIISSEHFHSRVKSLDKILELKSYLDAFFDEFKVISYIREQTQLIVSLYSTILKSGGVVELSEYASTNCKPNNDYFNYDLFLSKWQEAFGLQSMCVRLFDRNSFHKKSLLLDFLKSTHIEATSLNIDVNIENESLNPFGQLLQSVTNKMFPRHLDGLGINLNHQLLTRYVTENYSGKGINLAPNESFEIRERFLYSNELIKERYFKEHHGELFPVKSESPSSISISNEDVSKLIAYIHQFQTIASFPKSVEIPDLYADILRDTAIEYENKDINKSYHLMRLANKIRPNGPLIKNKLLSYSSLFFKS